MIGTVVHLARESDSPRIAGMLETWGQLMEAKERAGIERATAGGGFAAGVFTEAQIDRLRQLMIAQTIHLRLSRQAATAEHAAALDAALATAAAQDVERMRGIVFAGGLSGALEGITGPAWFARISEKIDALKAVEDRISADMLAAMAAIEAGAAADARGTLAVSAAALAGATALAGLLVITIRRSFRSVTGPMRRLAEGAIDVDLPPAGRNEFGAMIDALGVFRDTAAQKARLDAEAEARTAAALLRADAMEALRRSLAEAVAAGVGGDFSARVAADSSEADLKALAEGVNTLLTTVDGALRDVETVLTALADADLTQRMHGEHRGAFARLRDAANRTAGTLARLIGDIRASAETARQNAEAIARGAENLAGRSESQAASLEQTAATMEELAKTVASNAESLAAAETLARGTQSSAATGREKVGGAVTAVRRIETSAAKISEIVGVIDGIAFQTNLLALNAGVEAARAGDAGRGFAVVAFEVRALAERCTAAARDIAALVRDSGTQVAEGVTMVEATGAALAEIDGAVHQLTEAIGRIAAAGREQALGIDEINQAVTSMDTLTQQNAALADESLRSARALAGDVRALAEATAAFRIEAGRGRAGRAA
jgi:methyl-accepting chemotaxis protein